MICAYNNKQILETYLLRSLAKQNANYELLLVDNTDQRFDSHSSALNFGSAKATGDYLLFVHQDTSLCDADWLAKTEKVISKIDRVGACGSIGIRLNVCFPEIIGRIAEPNGTHRGRPVEKPTKVHTIDSILFIVPRDVFRIVKFDDVLLKGNWHATAADYCLALRRLDLFPYVIPGNVFHLSDRSRPFHSSAYSATKILLEKYPEYNLIWTTGAGGISSGVLGALKRNLGELFCHAQDLIGFQGPKVVPRQLR